MIGEGIDHACLVSGAAEGATELNAFDGALLAAGIGNLNLIKVSSIMPPHVVLEKAAPKLPPGAFVLVVYAARTSSTAGETLAAAVAAGRAKNGFGVIMEATGRSQAEVEEAVRVKVAEAFRVRNLELEEVHVAAAEHRVVRCGGVVAACLFF